jgi:predicted nucleic acid-binding protein
MKRYLLDTALLAAYLHKRAPALELLRPILKNHEAATSMIVCGEVIEYVKGLADFADRYAKFHLLLQEIPPYQLTFAVLERFAEIRRQIRQPFGKGLIGDMDTLIAATAIEYDLALLTIDRDFERVPDLKLQLVNLKAA